MTTITITCNFCKKIMAEKIEVTREIFEVIKNRFDMCEECLR